MAWAQIKHSPSRLIAILLAVVLSAAMLAGTVVFSATSEKSMAATSSAPLQPADVTLDYNEANLDSLNPTWARDAVAKADIGSDIAATAPYFAASATASSTNARGSATIYSIADDSSLHWFGLEQGAWPQGSDQIVVSRATADKLGITVGGSLSLKSAGNAPRTVTVSGISDVKFKPFTGVDFDLYANKDYFSGNVPNDLFIKLNDASQIPTVVAALNRVAPQGTRAWIGSELAQQAASRFAGGSNQLAMIMTVFAVIALLCASMVISSTYKTLIAQRTRDIAMLRLVGARQADIRTMILSEALITSLIGTLIGLLLGSGGGYLIMLATNQAFGGFAANPMLLLGCALVTIAMTVLSAWTTVRTATRIPPIQALESGTQTGDQTTHGRRHSRIRTIVGIVLVIIGIAALYYGSSINQMPFAFLGGLSLALGLVLALPGFVAAIMPGIPGGLSSCGVAGKLAASSLSSNVKSTGSGVTAIAFGIALIAALASAGATGTATINADLDYRYPVSAALYTPDGAQLSDQALSHKDDVTKASAAYLIRTAPISQTPEGQKTTPKVLNVIPDKAAESFAAGELDSRKSDTGKATGNTPIALVHPRYMSTIGIKQGDKLTFTVGGVPITVTAMPSQLTETARLSIIITDSQLKRIPEATTIAKTLRTSMIWYASKPGISRTELAGQVNHLAISDPDAIVGGGIAESNDILNVLNLLLTLSYAMLAITVLISLAGITNQLMLSVIERTNEISMLRALGTRRGIIRNSIAIESLTLTTIGTLIGLVVGLPLGITGVKAQIGGMTTQFTTAIPWAQVVVLIVTILIAGLVAAVIPARHATHIQPAEGLTS
jgi:putative ABC transport system permease protein